MLITEPSVPLDLTPTEVTNNSLAIDWRAPVYPNGADTFYMIYRNNEVPIKSLASQVKT